MYSVGGEYGTGMSGGGGPKAGAAGGEEKAFFLCLEVSNSSSGHMDDHLNSHLNFILQHDHHV